MMVLACIRQFSASRCQSLPRAAPGPHAGEGEAAVHPGSRCGCHRSGQEGRVRWQGFGEVQPPSRHDIVGSARFFTVTAFQDPSRRRAQMRAPKSHGLWCRGGGLKEVVGEA